MKLLKNSTLVLLLSLFTAKTCSQNYAAQRSQVFVTNILSNALIGGIGGAIHRDKDQKIYKAFIRNFIKGGVGGLVKYSAKYQAYYLGLVENSNLFYVNDFYAPFNRIYFFWGHSMVINAAYNRKLTDGYYCNFYGIDLKFRPKEEQKMQVRLSLASVFSAVEYGIKGYQFNLYRSLEYGQLLFDDPKGILGDYNGQARFNAIVIRKPNLGGFSVLPHEIVHTYQQYDYFGISSFYDKKARPVYETNKWYKALSNYVVLDYETLYMLALYAPQFRKPPNYYKNYFEFEAEHFSTRRPVLR